MVIFGVDTHKRNHTAVAVDEHGRELGSHTTGTTTDDHLRRLTWARRFGAQRTWAVEDCRQLSRRLEGDLLAAGEQIVRVPPKLMAHCRTAARTYAKSDPIDALAAARGALREPDLPTAHLDDASRDVRLLMDHRDDLVAERTPVINRLRWHLHELAPALDPPTRTLTQRKQVVGVAAFLDGRNGIVARLARHLLTRCQELTTTIQALEAEITTLVNRLAPALLQIPGCGALTAAKILGETAGNRQLNLALHRIAITQAHYHPEARAYL